MASFSTCIMGGYKAADDWGWGVTNVGKMTSSNDPKWPGSHFLGDVWEWEGEWVRTESSVTDAIAGLFRVWGVCMGGIHCDIFTTRSAELLTK
ncbi:hypothetical protein CEXT_518811 [Caerostris extrusa]|uniref:Uncharacterized protein n=1 Tax=Caerostris extrusa TaxID=172846 RepID=A0AAV4P3T0_CAEEX|nr:hypothetical protein CEXT_518811 [Caerostris extrusa]